eukprot:XP_006229712.1 PREDICTED: nascent polypeptide-associated complex subunit alpha, muscle-specific form-like isoform X2 [Rattus norvegicus]
MAALLLAVLRLLPFTPSSLSLTPEMRGGPEVRGADDPATPPSSLPLELEVRGGAEVMGGAESATPLMSPHAPEARGGAEERGGAESATPPTSPHALETRGGAEEMGGAESATPPMSPLAPEARGGAEEMGGAESAPPPSVPLTPQEVREPELRVRTDQATPLVAPEVEPELTGRTESATPPLAPEVRESELRGRTDPATPPGTPEVKFEPEVIQSATSVFTVGKMVSDAERPEIQGSGSRRTRKLRFKGHPSDLFPLLASVPPSSILALFVTAALLSVLCCLTFLVGEPTG